MQNAKEFIIGLCTVELGIGQLKQLAEIYRPPKFENPKGRGKKAKVFKPNDLSVRIVSLTIDKDYPESNNTLKEGRAEASKKRIDKSRHFLEDFYYPKRAAFNRRDLIMQIVDDGKNKKALPPSTVIHTKPCKNENRVFVYVETLRKNSKKLKMITNKLNPKERKAMGRDGFKSRSLSDKLIKFWK